MHRRAIFRNDLPQTKSLLASHTQHACFLSNDFGRFTAEADSGVMLGLLMVIDIILRDIEKVMRLGACKGNSMSVKCLNTLP